MNSRAFLLIIGLALGALFLADTAAVWARAGSGGSRGSRSYSAPARPSSPAMPTTPSSPSRSLSQPAPQRPGMFGGLMGGLAGFALGGLLGSMLFGGLGGFGGGLGGFGLLEMLIIGAVIFFAIRMFRSRQAPQPAYAGAGAAAGGSAYGATDLGGTGASPAVAEAPAAPSDLERGIGHLRQMDAGFDPDAFTRWAQAVFNDVQQGISRRDISALGDRLTPQEYARLQAQCDQLRGARHTNRIEQVVINRAELSEAWQESGQDWATVYFAVSLVDYTVDDTSGGLVDGSKSPQSVEEFWTFTRPVGPKPWRLSAIHTA